MNAVRIRVATTREGACLVREARPLIKRSGLSPRCSGTCQRSSRRRTRRMAPGSSGSLSRAVSAAWHDANSASDTWARNRGCRGPMSRRASPLAESNCSEPSPPKSQIDQGEGGALAHQRLPRCASPNLEAFAPSVLEEVHPKIGRPGGRSNFTQIQWHPEEGERASERAKMRGHPNGRSREQGEDSLLFVIVELRGWGERIALGAETWSPRRWADKRHSS